MLRAEFAEDRVSPTPDGACEEVVAAAAWGRRGEDDDVDYKEMAAEEAWERYNGICRTDESEVAVW